MDWINSEEKSSGSMELNLILWGAGIPSIFLQSSASDVGGERSAP